MIEGQELIELHNLESAYLQNQMFVKPVAMLELDERASQETHNKVLQHFKDEGNRISREHEDDTSEEKSKETRQAEAFKRIFAQKGGK